MSASQCLAHAWLKRKPLRHLEELDVAKDNLRCFVERWNEHPNSPYLFDVTGHKISLCSPPCEADSQHSLRGYSPSPCGSLSSSSSESSSVIEVPMGKCPDLSWPASPTLKLQPVPYHLERLHTFERRASDSSCLMPKSRDTASRVNLADEIRKLSDKLFQMAALHSSDSPPTITPVTTSNTTNNKTNNPILKSPTFVSHTTTTTTTYKFPNTSVPPQSRVSSLNPPVVDNIASNAKRTKFKVSNMNRDMPLGLPPSASNVICFANTSPCSSSGSSLSPCTSPEPEEAHLTKDLLLHLLSKWEDSQTAPTPSANCRKSSISVDWSDEETLGQRTMNSLSSYIQSSRIMEKKLPVAPP
ncbi:hypothetical protein PR048_030086 [Dryococelus australis]|uniref:Uncharacterized protein n=1 Tax=Dryococelus australis TaxID=614101 RepID=A0ABQ9G8D6_9NEOP|nr:hypothetical protein PR048_030086 [Dryococelus australis]